METNYKFPTTKQPLYLGNGEIYKDKEVVMRMDTCKILGTVSPRYQVVEHETVINMFDKVPEITRKDVYLPQDGAVMFADYSIKNGRAKKEVEVGDIVEFGVRAFNSHNEWFAVGFELTCKRLACLNGMLSTSNAMRVAYKHFQSFSIDKLRNNINSVIDSTGEVIERWQEWTTVKPEPEKVIKFFDELPINRKETEILMDKSLESKNLWEIYNNLTYYTSHQMETRESKNQVLNEREKINTLIRAFNQFNWN